MKNFSEVKVLIETIQKAYNKTKPDMVFSINLDNKNILKYTILYTKNGRLNIVKVIDLNLKEAKKLLLIEIEYLKEKFRLWD